jgi:tRNA-specific 2-thiouridylase
MALRAKTVFVGLSGGVDSAVTAALLKKQGFNVVGVFIKTWHPDFLECNEEEERRDAMRIAAHLDIPFLTFDLEKEYKKEVGDYMISEYQKGRTPNPDVMCNKEVKFGAFLRKALAMGADYVATGHYARVASTSEFFSGPRVARANFTGMSGINQTSSKNSEVLLLKNIDSSKDQSYFLWAIDKKRFSKILFPVGNLKKSQVRALAKKLKLPVAEKKDSQGICFLGPVDLKEFLAHYIKEKKGKVINEKSEVIGHHNGVTFFTLGERHGFTITKKSPNDKPYYIVAKDIKKNTLTVSHNKVSNSSMETNYKIANINWISGTPSKDNKYTAQIRYHGEFLPCRIQNNIIIFDKSTLVAPGQSIVVYDKDVCLGGGIVA